MSNQKEVKLHVENLTVSFRTSQGMVRAVRDVSFELYKGETLAIVGESGSGKSVTSRAIMGILAGNAVTDDGKIIYEGLDLTKVDEEHFHEIRGKKIGMIFQDPMSSLNPIMKIGQQITEGMILNGKRVNNRYKSLFNRSRTDYNELRRIKKTLKEELLHSFAVAKEENRTIDKALLKQEYAIKIKEMSVQIKKAKEVLKHDKAIAKQTVSQEWAAEKAKADNDIGKIHAKLSPGMSKHEKEKIDHEIEARREQLRRYKHVTRKEAYERAITVMREVGIPNPERRFTQYPFQFSGGMRQRIVIAIALTADPDILICDEPTTALDVTIQSQILELINKIKSERDLSVIFITHDMGVVANMSNRIGVMYAGKIVEIGTTEEVFYKPRHPYTWAMLGSMPDLDSKDRLIAIPGTPPNMLFPPVGDAFAERNKFAMKIDFEEQPPMFKISETHYAATWLLHPDAPKVDVPLVVQSRINRMLARAKEVVAK
jgi:oligopeptide transport system ATP-binding protein